ncbi:SurA N-terminal domain-containing protein [Thalassotalea crassostreae]|uniref:SurA N-terminal domain-containing protein n=1 Tax=Thalassotalea crassostreae TaxID=1763536 RepID=UPI00083998E7|nr:SurA N-terminal domain-containing protein [Thalassotalea crassostreae]
MLERIREGSTGITAKVILGLVIATFVFAGVGTYNNSVDTSAATVNEQKISQADFEQAYKNQRARMEQQYGEMFAQLAGNEVYMQNMRTSVLEQLINEELIDQNAKALSMVVSDQQIKDTILNMPEFQVDGKFDQNRYQMVISQAGFYQASAFRDYLRTDMARRQLMQSIMATEFSLPYQNELAIKLNNQTRNIRYSTIGAEQFKATVVVTDEEINEYYQANQARFATQEQVKLEYISLDIASLAKDVSVSESDAQSYYDNNSDSYSTIERRRASHILIETGDDESAAQAKAEEILAKINGGEDFAELAKTDSADTFSGENGGDLDWFEQGTMDPAFDEAVFALTMENNVSKVVQSEFGFHIIKLTDIEAATVQPFAEVQAEITEQLANDQALERFYDLQTQMAETAFESPDSLDEAASVIGATVQTSEFIGRSGNMAPFNNASVIDAAFSDVVLLDAMNSDVIEVETDQLAMVVRVLEHKPAATKDLSEVSEQIKTQLVNTKASEQAQQAADALLAQVIAAEQTTTTFETVENVTRRGGVVENNIAQQAFLLAHPVDGQVSAAATLMLNGDYAVVEVLSVSEGVASEADANIEQQQASILAQSAFASYIANLKSTAEITRNLPANSAPIF